MNEKVNVYPKGILFFKPNEKAPSWVKGELIISLSTLFEWAKDNPDVLTESEKYGKQLKLTITEKGLQVNTYTPQKKNVENFNKNEFGF